MSEAETVEQRLWHLESEVAELKRQVASANARGNWFQRVAGSFED